MVTGVEAAGLVLALLPLLVNQLDVYARGIEKIKVLRRYRREFAGYSVGLGTQYAILLNTLEQALEGLSEDDDEVSELINHPRGECWKSPSLQSRLRLKLGRDYELFVCNTNSLLEMLERLSRKLEISTTDSKASATGILKFRKVLSKAVYDGLLANIDSANTILKTLIEQSSRREATRKRRQPWNRLLRQYKNTRKHAEGLFKIIMGEEFWRCRCKDQHCVHLQLQTNPLATNEKTSGFDQNSKFRMVFSNTHDVNAASLWKWMEVELELSQVEQLIDVTNLSLNTEPKPDAPKRPQVRFEVPNENKPTVFVSSDEVPSTPRIRDLCQSLRIAEPNISKWDTIGFLSSDSDSTVRYNMHAIKKLQHHNPQRALRDVLSNLSRRDRLHIAMGLACGVIQFHGNWLKSNWNSSDVHLDAENNGYGAVADNLYLSWPLSAASSTRMAAVHPSDTDNALLPLGLTLVELSLGKPLGSLLVPDEHDKFAKFYAPSRLVKLVYCESGTNYAEAVNSCLSWSGIGTLRYEEKRFEERVFDTIISPLLKDFINFEGLT